MHVTAQCLFNEDLNFFTATHTRRGSGLSRAPARGNMRRHFTIIELFIVIAICVILTLLLISALSPKQITPVVKTPASHSLRPEKDSGYEVHNFPLSTDFAGPSVPSRIQNALVSWIEKNPNKDIVSVVFADGYLIIVARRK